jgi:anaerobic selenocysteine-containing dehydrogenase
MTLDRRTLLFGLGGGACGLALSPVPWKLLDDVSIWTQHRRALPVPPRGEFTVSPAACTLCPGGCALRVRRVGGRPVSVVGERDHPLGGGACPVGLTLHHLAYHPRRLSGPARRSGERLTPVGVDAALAEIVTGARAAQKSGLSVLVLDRRPGRVLSQAWCELLAGLPGGAYATVPGEDGTLAALRGALATPSPLGIDLERARMVLSFGAPVLDDWGQPGRVRASRRSLRVVQVDSRPSPSAALADDWLATAPEAEGPLALALVHAVLRLDPTRADEDVRGAVAEFSPASVSARVGIEAGRIEALARSLLEAPPALAIGGGEPGAGPLSADAESAIALLNVVLGNLGRPGGFVPRRPVPEAPGAQGATVASLREVPAGSVGLAILDAADDGRALPWPLVERTLAPGALVVSLSPFDPGFAAPAALLLPAPAPLECHDELLPATDAAVASYALSAPLLQKPGTATEPSQVMAALAAGLGVPFAGGTHEERLRQRVAAIRLAGRGRFVAREKDGYADAAPADAASAWDLLAAGGCWIDAALPSSAAFGRWPLPSSSARERWRQPPGAEAGLALVPFAARATSGSTPVSPILSKLYQETELRVSARVASVHPRTGEVLGLRAGRRVFVESGAGRVLAELRFDPALPEGRLALATGPVPALQHPGAGTRAMQGALPLLSCEPDGTWRATRVRVWEA